MLFQNEYSSNFLFELWKRVRKMGACCTGISQNLEDMLQSHTARTMPGQLGVSHPAQSSGFRPRGNWARLLNISDTQLNYITNADVGKGLIRCAGSIVPFESQFPRDSRLYRLNDHQLEEVEGHIEKGWKQAYGQELRKASLIWMCVYTRSKSRRATSWQWQASPSQGPSPCAACA